MKKHNSPDQEIFRFIHDMKRKEKKRKDTFGDIRPIIQVEAKGKRFVAVGSQLFSADNWWTFPDFLFDYLKIVFGEDWFKNEISKLHEQQHPVIQWRYSAIEFQKSLKKK